MAVISTARLDRRELSGGDLRRSIHPVLLEPHRASQEPEMKYPRIYRSRHLWPVRLQCEVLEVSFTGYHQHLMRRRPLASRRHMTDASLLVHIRAIHAELRGAYGWPRMWRELRRRGVRVGKERVRLLMRQHGIQARDKRRFRIATTDSNHRLAVAPNVLARNFSSDQPNKT